MLPKLLLKKLSLLTESGAKSKLRQEIISYYSSLPSATTDPEIKEALAYLKDNRLQVFPYNFTSKYKAVDTKVYLDKALGMRYVIHEGKKLYFKRTWGERKIKRNYSFLLLEQDLMSPHRYLTDAFAVAQGDVVADAGAAEGNFALSVIDKVKKIYLFETDNKWIEALEATFAPWKEKVEIVNKFVSNSNDAHNLTLDSFFENKGNVNFIKADVECAEADLLEGSKKILAQDGPLKVAITTYHKQQDQQELNGILQGYGFKTEFSKGYMLFPYYEPIKPPYFRRGLIRATK
ncbi:FkbM family methyltransferase [uncultured Pontibacter sp.]|uniref:FkbM family methyltransferase n=1 Tax=uncultured Pontibacter sp. TaxID=453356 RepID=UPI0026318F3D|nr:FkbM family methyltransferase [uncultured Pontibacter sp.]